MLLKTSHGTSISYRYLVQGVQDLSRYYPNPKSKALHIKDHIAFYKVRRDAILVEMNSSISSLEQSDY